MNNFLDELDENKLNKYQKNKKLWLKETDYTEESQKTFWRMLNSNVLFREEVKQKDLYEFSKTEIIEVIKTIPTNKISSKRSMFSVIRSYIRWASKRGLNYMENPCDTIEINDIVTVDSDVAKYSYLTLEDFYEFLEEIVCSDVDKMILVLLRYGVKLSLVPEMKFEDIDEDEMKLYVHTKKDKVLSYPIDNEFIVMARRCNNCTEFEYTYPAEKEEDRVSVKTAYPPESKYIIKNTNRSEGAKININSLYSRINLIFANNKIQRLSPNELNKARKFDFLFRGYQKFGEVDFDDIKSVLEVFDGGFTSNKNSALKADFELVSNIKVKRINYGLEAQRKIVRKRKDIFS